MAKLLFFFMFLLLGKVVQAQETTPAFVTATIVSEAVGTGEFLADYTPLVTIASTYKATAVAYPLLVEESKEITLAKFSVQSQKAVYAITTSGSAEPSFVRKTANSFFRVSIKPLSSVPQQDVYVLHAHIPPEAWDTTASSKNGVQEVMINFN